MIKKMGMFLAGAALVVAGVLLALYLPSAEKEPEAVVATTLEEAGGEAELVIAPEPDQEITMVAVGDIMLARKVERLMQQHGRDYPLLEVKERLRQPDLTFGNLECAVSDRGTPLPGKGIWLRASPEVLPQLETSGFDILSIANNHSLDYDAEAFLDTLDLLEQTGIATVGGGKDIIGARSPRVMTVKGVRIGFLAYTEMADTFWSYDYPRKFKATETEPGVAPYDYAAIIEDVVDLRDQADLLVLSVHWGTEYSHYPSSLQREHAHGMIDAGADVIVGHHPHVVQGVEVYNGGLIAYSLGNFVFDQNQSDKTREGLVMELKADKSGITQANLYPVIIRESQPRFEQSSWAAGVVRKVRDFSLALDTESSLEEEPLKITVIDNLQ
jgi:poly-gamma-glutamate capsule biosynthesis protein CapA/YwtB (metallophosphatase superfamily)